jgi:lipid-A-disaccharide synthase
MRYYLIAGEASGDLHGSNLMKAIRKFDSQAVFHFFGGDLMSSVADGLVSHYKDTAYMGMDVVFHLGAITHKIKLCKKDILSFQPDVVILIDYPGFNMRIARFLHKKRIRVYYYIAPKAWAWKKRRVYDLKKYVDKLYVIFPFEIEFFRQYGIQVEYFGNPLIDSIHQFFMQKESREIFVEKYHLGQKPIIALVPGSRKNEIRLLLPEMIEAAKKYSDNYQLVITGAPSVEKKIYDEIIGDSQIPVIFNETYQIVSNAVAAVVTSGTATLETALLRTPQVVVFKASWLSFVVGRPIVRIAYFSLVNIIAGKEVVKELLQFNLARDISNELDKLLNDKQYVEEMQKNYAMISEQLGNPGVSERIAHNIFDSLQ